MKKLLFLFNPVAGKGRLRPKIADILDLFIKQGYDVTVHTTQSRDDARKTAAARGCEFDRIICAGGDGTLNEVINGVMACGEHKPEVGYIPTGTTNDFAKTLGLPVSNMIKAATCSATGTAKQCDVGCFNGKYYTYTAAFGAFTDVSYNTSQKFKNVLGHAAYVVRGLETLPSLKSYPMKVYCNGTVIQDSFIFGMVSNSESIGGFRAFSKGGVLLTDGLFEIVLIRYPKTLQNLNEIITGLLSKQLNRDGIIYLRSNEVRFESQQPVAWTLDGEFGQETQNTEIRIIPSAVPYVSYWCKERCAPGSKE